MSKSEDEDLSDDDFVPLSFTARKKCKNLEKCLLPLVQPNTVLKSSKDPNRGLYPQKRKKSSEMLSTFSESSRRTAHSCPGVPFCSASDVLSEKLNHGLSSTTRINSHSQSWGAGMKRRQNDKAVVNFLPQTNYKSPECSPQKPKNLNTKRKSKETVVQKNSLDNYYNIIVKPNQSKKQKTSEESHKVETEIVLIEDENFVENDIDCDIPKCCTNQEPQTPKDVPYTYGLFGSTPVCEADDRQNYFAELPDHVLEQIFCQIPFLDLLSNRLVCTNWNEIISDKLFVAWKKMYFRYKIQGCDADLIRSCKAIISSTVEDCFYVLISYVQTGFNRKVRPKVSELLRGSRRCLDAEEVILERFPDWSKEGVNPWAIIAVCVLTSERVADVVNLFNLLTHASSPCSLHEIVNGMYCIATFLLYFKNELRINHGLHYRMYYAIYLMENVVPVDYGVANQSVNAEVINVGQQSIHSYCDPVAPRLTYEQMRILNHRLRPKQIVKIVAFAGTGKTTTLIRFAQLYPQLKFLNVMFNKAVCEYAKTCFPSNVTCKTSHSLAYADIGHKYKHKITYKLRPHDVYKHIEKPESVKLHYLTYAKYVAQTVNTFSSSADEFITIAHVPRTTANINDASLSDRDRLAICRDAEILWENMIDLRQQDVKITHDTYLKLFQLKHPIFNTYDCIMIDEAQDSNGAMLDIMLTQNVPVILVGDPNQQIYSFRGATNAIQNIPASHIYHLTKSFRFGPEISYVASCCLEVLKCNHRETIVGTLKDSSIDGTANGQYAIIARSNIKLFKEAMELCCTSNRVLNQPQAIYGAFAGGISGYGFDQIIDIWKLKSNEGKLEGDKEFIRDRFVRKFNHFADLLNYAKKAEEIDLQGKIEIVSAYHEKVVEYIEAIKKKCSCKIELANVVFSTAHKAKGLEFDTVYLSEDFQVPHVPCKPATPESEYGDEYNILYVALTRAKRCLIMPQKLSNALLAAQEKFEYPIPKRKLLESGITELVCAYCSSIFVPHTTFVLVKRKIILSGDVESKAGPFCMKCSTKPNLRPATQHGPALMLGDLIPDNAHLSMKSLVGPLPSDDPIDHELPEAEFEDAFIFQLLF